MRVRIKNVRNVLYSATGVVKAIKPTDYPKEGIRFLVATDDGRKGLFEPSELRAA